MESIRLLTADSLPLLLPCCRCGQARASWDRIASKAYCPNCQELLIVGEADPLVERTEKNCCAICNHQGTVCFQTFPWQTMTPLAIDLCPDHLRCLIGRRLNPQAYLQLCRKLILLGFHAEQLFLLHQAFYDGNGQALQPAIEVI
jgi:hypothetical protein